MNECRVADIELSCKSSERFDLRCGWKMIKDRERHPDSFSSKIVYLVYQFSSKKVVIILLYWSSLSGCAVFHARREKSLANEENYAIRGMLLWCTFNKYGLLFFGLQCCKRLPFSKVHLLIISFATVKLIEKELIKKFTSIALF